MATANLHTSRPVTLEWRTGYQHRGNEPVDAGALDYILDGDDPLARAARSTVRILPVDPVIAAVAARSNLSIDETTEILDGFMSALKRAEGGAA